MYLNAVSDAFADEIDYAQLVKVFGADPDGARTYSPAQCLGTQRVEIIGTPDPAHVSTSYVERQNLNMRMNMRRFTRLTNAFSKKWENLWAAYCLHFAFYNFCRIHSMKVTLNKEGRADAFDLLNPRSSYWCHRRR